MVRNYLQISALLRNHMLFPIWGQNEGELTQNNGEWIKMVLTSTTHPSMSPVGPVARQSETPGANISFSLGTNCVK